MLLFIMIFITLQPLYASEDSSYRLVTTGLRDRFNSAFHNEETLKALCHEIYTQRKERARAPSFWFQRHFPVIIAEVCLDNYAAAAASASEEEAIVFQRLYAVLNDFIVDYEKLVEGSFFIQNVSNALNSVAREQVHIHLVKLLPCLPQKKTAYQILLQHLWTDAAGVFVPKEGLWNDVILTGTVCVLDRKIVTFLYNACKAIPEDEVLDLENAVLTNDRVVWFAEKVNDLAVNEAYPISTRLLYSVENLKECLSTISRIPVENHSLIKALIERLFLSRSCIITDRRPTIKPREPVGFRGYFKDNRLRF